MTKAGKTSKLLITLTLLVLAFCCSFQITNAYFTASSTRSGALEFSNLNVKFVALDSNGDVADESQTITLYPMASAIIRGDEFLLSLDSSGEQNAIGSIIVRNMDDSIQAYTRLWIDAYIITNESTGEVDTTKNYGEYFLLNPGHNRVARGGGTNKSSNATEASWCYYVTTIMDPYLSANANYASVLLGNTLELSEDTSDQVFSELVGHKIKISINLQAVQKANGAATSAFNDKKGYYPSWS